MATKKKPLRKAQTGIYKGDPGFTITPDTTTSKKASKSDPGFTITPKGKVQKPQTSKDGYLQYKKGGKVKKSLPKALFGNNPNNPIKKLGFNPLSPFNMGKRTASFMNIIKENPGLLAGAPGGMGGLAGAAGGAGAASAAGAGAGAGLALSRGGATKSKNKKGGSIKKAQTGIQTGKPIQEVSIENGRRTYGKSGIDSVGYNNFVKEQQKKEQEKGTFKGKIKGMFNLKKGGSIKSKSKKK